MEHVTDDCTCEGKKCNGCEETLCIDKFYRRKKNNRLFPRCKECSSQDGKKKYQANREQTIQRVKAYRQKTNYHRKYYQATAEHQKQKSKSYYAEHRDEQRIKKRFYDHLHAEHIRAYAQLHKERRNERASVRRNARPEHFNAINRACYHRNPAHTKAYRQHWYQDHREKCLAFARKNAAKRRAKKLIAGGSYTVQEWENLKEKYNYTCLWCKRSDMKLTVDHVIPLSRGGANSIDNIQPLCGSCNSRKKNRIIDFRGENP